MTILTIPSTHQRHRIAAYRVTIWNCKPIFPYFYFYERKRKTNNLHNSIRNNDFDLLSSSLPSPESDHYVEVASPKPLKVTKSRRQEVVQQQPQILKRSARNNRNKNGSLTNMKNSNGGNNNNSNNSKKGE
jgi:hypothetical protein